ncbi:MAG: tRNA lysidine(34) synthetase TilS [Sphingobacteriales bacterium]|nr:tRNA lysidine(34) synthetase TilS [Sphingobacteriales bacterium]
MNLLSLFVQHIIANGLFKKTDKLLIAVSGGVDSVVLCDLCFSAGLNFEMAHCNFQLREEESEADEKFVIELASKYKVKYHVVKFETENYAADNKQNIQLAARNLRYEWFNDILSNDSAITNILTAHHADDNLETILMNFFKGTGINGLKGIQSNHAGIGGKIVRPLLFANKSELIDYAQSNNCQWREDVSNESDKYTRNFFRNQIIPLIENVIPEAKANIQNNIKRFNEIAVIYDNAILNIKSKLLERKGNEIHIPVLKLLKIDAFETILFEIIKPYNFTSSQLKDAVNLLHADSGKYVMSGTHRILKNRNWLIISPNETQDEPVFIIESDTKIVHFGSNKITIENTSSTQFSNDSAIALLDMKNIQFPLLLRKWKQGDYFYPLGMLKKKKLSRFFIDIKLSLLEKENTWVIESNKKIIWVVGKRIDNRFKITETTESVLKLTLTSSK